MREKQGPKFEIENQKMILERVIQPKVPTELMAEQAWFGGLIATPLTETLENVNFRKTHPEAAEEATKRLRKVNDLDGLGRIEVYNRQYWFRLISVMQVDYLCTLHVIGLRRYNAWVIQFLQAYLPDSPYLNTLDARFEFFLQEHYNESNREVVLEALAYDRAFALAFEAGLGEKLDLGKSAGADLLSLPLHLMPHVTALRLKHDWPSYRVLCLADETLEQVFDFPMPKLVNCVIYRHETTLFEKEMPGAACSVLRAMREPGTLTEIFDRLPELAAEEQADLETHLSEWFQDFVQRGWVGAPSRPGHLGA